MIAIYDNINRNFSVFFFLVCSVIIFIIFVMPLQSNNFIDFCSKNTFWVEIFYLSLWDKND